MTQSNGLRFVENVGRDEIPMQPDDLVVDNLELEYVDFGFMNPQDNWRILAFIQYAEEEYGNPKYFQSDGREVYMDWAFEDAKWEYGILDIDEPDVRNAISDYLAYVREWNDGNYVHPFAFA